MRRLALLVLALLATACDLPTITPAPTECPCPCPPPEPAPPPVPAPTPCEQRCADRAEAIRLRCLAAGGTAARCTSLAAAHRAACLRGCGIAPPPTPTPPPPTPAPPAAGYDCLHPPELAGVVAVEEPVAGRYLVVLRPEAAGTRVAALAAGYAATDVRSFGTVGSFACSMDAAAAARMAADPAVAYVQQAGRVRVNAAPGWNLDRSDQRALPLDGVYDPGASGAGVHAYVLDTGLDAAHPAFVGRVGEGFASVPGGTADDHGHGTHTAGTVGGVGYGVASAVTLHPVRVLTAGSGSTEDVVGGINWVVAHEQAHGWPAVANMSLGGGAQPAMDAAVCQMIAAGVTVAVAAGNSHADACGQSPARVVQVLTAGATDSADAKASFSNLGGCVDLFAPGVAVVSAQRGGGEVAFSGTSMASPHVAGAAALCLERHPGGPISACVLERATPGTVGNPGAGSPNRLLYARDDLP